MKTSCLVIALASSIVAGAQTSGAGTQTTLLPPTAYSIVANDANSRVWEGTAYEQGTNGIAVPVNRRYTELGTGMYFTNSYGQLVESKDEIDTYSQGAIASRGPYQVIFANNLNSAGAIDQQTPDGKRLRSNIIGLAYYDSSSGSNVLIATIQDSQGELISSNQVLYPNAFVGVKADVRYTYKKGSLEQDVILLEQPPTPESLGLNSQSTEIEVLTEFINPPQASIVEQPVKTNSLPDEDISWGVMRIGRGRAFDLGEPRNSHSRVSVRRQLVTAQGRNILVEGVPLKSIKTYLVNLPLQASITTKLPMLASKTLALPLTPLAQAEPKPMKLAFASSSNKGFVLDFKELNYDTNDITFQTGTTYYISSGVNISGTATFEGGTVLKFPEDGSEGLNCEGNVVCDTTNDSPAVFTSVNDDSVGDPLSGISSGSPAEGGNNYIETYSTRLNHCRFYYAGTAVTTFYIPPASSSVLDDVQFYQCCWGIEQGDQITVNNGLVSGCWIFGDGGIAYQNVTFDNCYAADTECSMYDNCIFSSMANIVYDYHQFDDGEAPYNSSNNGFCNCDSSLYFGNNPVTDNNPFQSAANANYYLSVGSPFHGSGTTSIFYSGLLVELQTLTTYAPQDGGYLDTSASDLGFHYSPYEDSTYNGIADSWIWQNFGNYNENGSTLDSGGIYSLLYYYTNNMDPNAISFSLFTTNIYANTGFAAVQVSVSSGFASYQAVLVNCTNFSGATWTSYTSSNLTVTLGTTQGEYAVWVGLKGMTGNAPQTWQEIDFTNDTTPPVLVITNPAPIPCTLGIPLVQVQGYANKQLAALTFDVSNATGVVAGQPGTVMQQYFDTNSWSFTTNYFQCFDILLVTGMNLVTIHATDLAGNQTTSNLLLNLDFSTRTNPPLVSLTFPQNGMEVSGTNFTMDGFVDDPTATISVQIVDTNGDTNVMSGVVERNGRFWVDNMPLAGGTNLLTLTVTDAAGHTSVTNIGVIQSAVTLAITPVDPNLLWQSVVNVTGTISDSGYAVSVNGISADVNGNTWSATNVPVTAGGVASFTVMATAGGQTQAATKSSAAKPDSVNGSSIIVQSDIQMMHTDTHDVVNWWPDQTETGQKLSYDETWTTGDMNQHWSALVGGTGTSITTSHVEHGGWTGPPNGWVENAPVYSTNAWAYLFSPLDPVPYDYSSYLTFSSGSGQSLYAGLGYESCNVQTNPNTTITNWGSYGPPGSYGFCNESNSQTYWRTAQTTMMLLSGGRGIPGEQILHYISGWAKDVIPPLSIEARPSPALNPGYPLIWDSQTTPLGNEPSLPNSSVGLLGDTLHDDPNLGSGWGSLYYVTVTGAGPMDCTPVVTGHNFYTWQLYDTPHYLSHQTVCPALTDTNLARLNLGVGEYVTLSGMPGGTSWSASAGGIITNWDGAIIFTAPSNAPAGGTNATVTASVGGKSLTVVYTVFPPSGIDNSHTYIVETNFYPVSLLQTGQAGAGMHLHVCMAPTDVSFYRVTMEEVGENATNVTGYFTNTYLAPSHIGNGADDPFTLNWDNSWPVANYDYCYSPIYPPSNPNGFWFPGGSYTWNIPWEWWVDSSIINTNATGWQQVFSLNPYGTVTITKFGSEWVQRMSDGTITNSK